jgi:hypothetical protein
VQLIKSLSICLALVCTSPASAAPVDAFGSFAPHPTVPGVLSASTSFTLENGFSLTAQSLSWPVLAEHLFTVTTAGLSDTASAFSTITNPGETFAFSRSNTGGTTLIYDYTINVLAASVATLSLAQQGLFSGTPTGLFASADVSGSGGPKPIPLPAAGWLLIAALGGLRLMRRRLGELV